MINAPLNPAMVAALQLIAANSDTLIKALAEDIRVRKSAGRTAHGGVVEAGMPTQSDRAFPPVSDPHHAELLVVLRALRHTKGYPPIRTIARHTNLSPATVSRIFTGSTLPTWESIKLVIKALDGSPTDLNRCRAAWVSAKHTGEVGRQAHRQPARRSPGAADIEINGGTMHIADAALTAGKSIEVNDGSLFLTAVAAQAAARIEVNGGTVHIEEPPASSPEHTESPSGSGPEGTLLALPTGKPADYNGLVPFLRRVQ